MKIRIHISTVLTVLALALSFSAAKAQISFPKGNVIDTVISVDLAYYETQLIFNTGKYISSDYKYVKISDSLDPNWFVTACFNGECRNDLEDSGKFLSDFGIDDTTCFIAFHVESHDINGQSRIKYKVINTKNYADTALLDIKVRYKSPTAIIESTNSALQQVQYYPNPATDGLHIKTEKTGDGRVKIYNSQGKLLLVHDFANTNHIYLNTPQFGSGFYLIQTEIGESSYAQKIIFK